jgi:hypothetical protein
MSSVLKVAAAIIALVSSAVAEAQVITLDVKANIDGRDQLVIQGGNAYW